MNKNAAMVSIIGHPKKRLKSAAAGSKRGGIGCNERIGVGFALTEMQPVTIPHDDEFSRTSRRVRDASAATRCR